MDTKDRRTVIDISKTQPVLDFEDEEYIAEFTLPDYQRGLLAPRAWAFLTDLLIVLGLYMIFLAVTLSEMPTVIQFDRRMLGIYGAAYLMFVSVYFFLFMLSLSQTTGMRVQRLMAVSRHGNPLRPPDAILRSFGYLISVLPLFSGFLWAFVDPEHLTWTDKVSGTFIKRV